MAIILAGGYAQRLGPIGRRVAKPLLPIAGKPIVEHITEKIIQLDSVRRIIISTNLRFQHQFEEWLATARYGHVEIAVDKSKSEREKPGAVKALAQITRNVNEDVLVIAGDNLFTSSLQGMLELFRRRTSTTVAVYDVKHLKRAKPYATVVLDKDGRIVDYREKPDNPLTTLIGTCIYILPEKTLPRLWEYLNTIGNSDHPGGFIEWLHKVDDVYGYVLDGEWWDIGTPETYRQANKSFTRK